MSILEISSITLCVSFTIAYIATVIELKKTRQQLTKTLLENVLLNELSIATNDKSDQEVHAENFIKFLSDSREWAFEYIEKVQSEITAFVEELEPTVKYWNNYGKVVPTVHDDSIDLFIESYYKIKNLIPEESENKE